MRWTHGGLVTQRHRVVGLRVYSDADEHAARRGSSWLTAENVEDLVAQHRAGGADVPLIDVEGDDRRRGEDASKTYLSRQVGTEGDVHGAS